MSRATPPTSLLTLTAPKAAPVRAPEEGFSEELDNAAAGVATEPTTKTEHDDTSRSTDNEAAKSSDDTPSDDGAVERPQEESETSQAGTESSDETTDDAEPVVADVVLSATDDTAASDASTVSEGSEAVEAPTDLEITPLPRTTDQQQNTASTTASETLSDSADLAGATPVETTGVDADLSGDLVGDPTPDDSGQKVAASVNATTASTPTSEVSQQPGNSESQHQSAIPSVGEGADASLDGGDQQDLAQRQPTDERLEPSEPSPAAHPPATSGESSATQPITATPVASPVEAVAAEAVNTSTGLASIASNPLVEQGARTPEPSQPPAVDPARFVSRVARAFESAQQRGGGPIEVRLSPPELGTVQLKLEVSEGVLSASIETETQAARNALLDNLPALRERLAEQDIRVEKFDVDVRDENRQPELPERRDDQAERDASGSTANETQSTQPRDADADASASTSVQTIRFSENRINLVA